MLSDQQLTDINEHACAHIISCDTVHLLVAEVRRRCADQILPEDGGERRVICIDDLTDSWWHGYQRGLEVARNALGKLVEDAEVNARGVREALK